MENTISLKWISMSKTAPQIHVHTFLRTAKNNIYLTLRPHYALSPDMSVCHANHLSGLEGSQTFILCGFYHIL